MPGGFTHEGHTANCDVAFVFVKCARVDSNHWPHPPEASSPGRPAPTRAELRGSFVLGAGPARFGTGRCVTQSVAGDSLGATPLNPAQLPLSSGSGSL